MHLIIGSLFSILGLIFLSPSYTIGAPENHLGIHNHNHKDVSVPNTVNALVHANNWLMKLLQLQNSRSLSPIHDVIPFFTPIYTYTPLSPHATATGKGKPKTNAYFPTGHFFHDDVVTEDDDTEFPTMNLFPTKEEHAGLLSGKIESKPYNPAEIIMK